MYPHAQDSKDGLRRIITLAHSGRCWRRIVVLGGSASNTYDLTVHLVAPRTSAELMIACVGRNDDNVSLRLRFVHAAPETFGRITVRAALYGASRLQVHGVLDVTDQGKGSDTYFSGKALLMSPEARAEIEPHLEIKTDAVRASHGASIGRIDPRQLFYLQSRGLARPDAEKIILAGFFGDTCQNATTGP
ncbi:MAG: Fe-S cluster assembly protein SufD [Parcubacteria group bacterium Gr01-1014_106]|nr:MAG: Fe-S cluster assembly protein SufD [Parcubacteria group bacterium Gr01-1014_106]